MYERKTVGCAPYTIGEIPSSYLVSMTYEEQLIYLMKKMQEIIDFANNKISDTIKEYIYQNFNDIMMSTAYDEETETLILYLEEGENNE